MKFINRKISRRRKFGVAAILTGVAAGTSLLVRVAAFQVAVPANLARPTVPVPPPSLQACVTPPTVVPAPTPDTNPPAGATAPPGESDAAIQNYWDTAHMNAAVPDTQQHSQTCIYYNIGQVPNVGLPPISGPGTTPLPTLTLP